MASDLDGSRLVHSHTWYANLAGHLAKLLHGVPHVATTHSLEPSRPWKAEQLGGGYRLSSWCERVGLEGADAVIAVSKGMREDVLAAYPALDSERVHVIGNGIDTNEYRRVETRGALERYGVREPYVLFVGRITKQKGLSTLLAAAPSLEGAQLVLAAGAPDTEELARETEQAVARLDDVVWIEQMLPKPEVIELLSHARVFVCPSIYEPLGIVDLEAMACETAVVASRVGGIPRSWSTGRRGSWFRPRTRPRSQRDQRARRDPVAADAHGRSRPSSSGRVVRRGPASPSRRSSSIECSSDGLGRGRRTPGSSLAGGAGAVLRGNAAYGAGLAHLMRAIAVPRASGSTEPSARTARAGRTCRRAPGAARSQG